MRQADAKVGRWRSDADRLREFHGTDDAALPLSLISIYALSRRRPSDINGNPLPSEVPALFAQAARREPEYDDPAFQDFVLECFDVLDEEARAHRAEVEAEGQERR